LREDVLDVGDKQFLVLLFMIHAEHEERLDLIERLLVCI
jgi:mannitol/fructose-specific phosphotransferase system IIA component